MLTKLLQRLRGDLVVSLARTFVARGIAAIGGILLVLVLGRLYGPAGVGAFALAQGVYLGAGILARYGMNDSLIRFVGENHTSIAIKTYLRWAINKAVVLSVAAGVVVYLLGGKLADWFDAPMLVKVMPGIALAIPAFTVAFVLGGFMKGIRRPATACLLENGSISLYASGIVLLLNAQYPLGITNAGWGMAIAAWVVLGQGAWQAWHWLHRQQLTQGEHQVTRQEFSNSSRAFFVMSMSNFMQNVVGVLIAGWLLNSADLGLFRAAERTALLIAFILLVINAVLPPRFARLYRQGDLEGLSSLARKGALLGIGLASPLLLLCLLVPHWILDFFGPDFSDAANLVRILAVAQVVNVATGSVGFLLNMTGHEKLMRNIALSCNALGLVMFFILIHLFQVLGSALALALVLVMQNLTALIFVWRKLGIWMLPVPNFLKWMHIDRQEAL